MYDIRQFKPMLYFLVMLGLSGFAIALQTPLLWAFSMVAVGINAWLVWSGRFLPLPRWIANGVTLLAVIFIFHNGLSGGGPPLMFIGQFLVFLQLIKFFEQRANRDFAQLIVLSLLLMVAASIQTASLLFGVLMLIYLIISLYCCLIFHLKCEADRAKIALAIPEEKFSPATLRQDQRYLGRSMRRLTGLVAVIAVVFAVIVFLFFPRSASQGVLGQLQFRPPTALTGFSDQVSFDQINEIKQNDEVVGHVMVWKNDTLIEGTQTLLLRGYTLDVYGLSSARTSPKPQWTRSRSREIRERDIADENEFKTELEPGPTSYRQRFLLKPTGSRYLFALAGPLKLTATRPLTLRYIPTDGSLSTEAVNLPLEYEVTSLNAPFGLDMISRAELMIWGNPTFRGLRSDPQVLKQILAYTLQPEITDGLAAKRNKTRPMWQDDEEIARRIEHHLKTKFTYTLDLTDSKRLFAGSDPVVAFLTKVKSGHCEYFASAMTLMCQSLGMQARIVVGFKCDEYNVLNGQYIIRQSQAHTWMEILTPRGWVSFDPTSGRETHPKRTQGMWQSLKHFFDYLDFKWAENVVAYENKDRTQLIERLDGAMMKAAYMMSNFLTKLRGFRQWFESKTSNTDFWDTSFSALVIVICLMFAVMLGLILTFLIQQERLRRRAARIGLDALPIEEQLRLAKQLTYYDELARILHHHAIHRPPHLTPLEFSESLVFLPGEIYRAIHGMTRVLYRVRYGGAKLSASQQHRLKKLVGRVETLLNKGRPAVKS